MSIEGAMNINSCFLIFTKQIQKKLGQGLSRNSTQNNDDNQPCPLIPFSWDEKTLSTLVSERQIPGSVCKKIQKVKILNLYFI